MISKSDTNALSKKISEEWKIELPKVKNFRIYQVEGGEIITGSDLRILKIKDTFVPFLSDTKLLEKFPYVMVDMGAVKFMCNGANVMRPGIKKYSKFDDHQVVCIIEESQHKFLAVGKAVIPSEEMTTIKKGEVIKNLHFVSDKFWEIGKTIELI